MIGFSTKDYAYREWHFGCIGVRANRFLHRGGWTPFVWLEVYWRLA